MTRDEVHAAVRDQTPARTFYAFDREATHSGGTVIAYCDAPQFLIRCEDGTQFWWRADLTELNPSA